MSKKIIITAAILGTLALGGGAFVIGSTMNKPVTADEDLKAANGILTELKVGKYYLEGGTENEYIEVFDGETLQVFGLDYFKLVSDLNADWIATLNEEQYAEFVEAEQDLVDFWNARHYYWLSEKVKSIGLSNECVEPEQLYTKSPFVLGYFDENTLEWDDDHIYKFAE